MKEARLYLTTIYVTLLAATLIACNGSRAPLPEGGSGESSLPPVDDTFTAKERLGKLERELADLQEETFTVTYDACYPIGEVYALLKSGSNCELIPVPGVIDCSSIPCVEWAIDASIFNFFVKKPGIFASRLATMMVEGNIGVNIAFESFGDLLPLG